MRLPGGSTRIEIIPQMTTTVPRQAQRPSRLPTITTAERKRLLDSLPEDQGEEDSEVWVQTITAARMDTAMSGYGAPASLCHLPRLSGRRA